MIFFQIIRGIIVISFFFNVNIQNKISTSYGIRQSNIKFEKEGSAFFNNSLILKK